VSALFLLSYVALWLLVLFQTLVILGLARTVYRRDQHEVPDSTRDEDPIPVGEPAPRFTALDVAGARVDETVFSGSLTALLFVSPGCSTCVATLSEVEALRRKVNGDVVVVCRAEASECGRLGELYGLRTRVIVDHDHSVSDRFGVRTTPTAVLVGPTGRILTHGYPMHGEELERLFGEGAAEPELEEASQWR
jgi:peroxiredoxin